MLMLKGFWNVNDILRFIVVFRILKKFILKYLEYFLRLFIDLWYDYGMVEVWIGNLYL